MNGRPLIIAASLTAIAACNASLPAAAPAPSGSNNLAAQLIGVWRLELRLDSVMSRESGTAKWRPGAFRTTVGRLTLTDSLAGAGDLVRSHIDVAFDSLLGRPMSCFDPRPTTTALSRDGDTIHLRFTPSAYDCGFSAAGTLHGDSLIGTWDETSFAGPIAMGQFRMVRTGR